MIVGEDQIQGQVKRAYEAALERETAGPLTNHLFKAALATGKRVRTETAIGEGQLSLPSVSAMLASEMLGDLNGRRRRDHRHRRDRASWPPARSPTPAARLVFVATRRRDRAVSLAERFDADERQLRRAAEALIARRRRRLGDLLAASADRGERAGRGDGRSAMAGRC